MHFSSSEALPVNSGGNPGDTRSVYHHPYAQGTGTRSHTKDVLLPPVLSAQEPDASSCVHYAPSG